MKKLVVVILAAALSQVMAEKLRFDNHTLYRITPTTKELVEVLRQIEKEAYITGYNFFSELGIENTPVDILVPPKHAQKFKDDILEHPDVKTELLNENIQGAIDAEGVRPASRANTFGWTNYYTLDEINRFLQDTAAANYSSVTLLKGGETYLGRDILGLKLQIGSQTGRQSVFIEANIHAREWITSAVATYLINELVHSTDPEIRELAESYIWYIFPVTNPDGFAHSHTNNRLWRKTRTPYSFLCFGVDPNRNWPYQWMTGGASDSPCSDIYAGPFPLSEKSTRTLSEFIDSVGEELVAYISFHSYSQMLLLPYGHTTAHLDNYDEMMEIGRQAIIDLSKKYGTQYVVGNIAEIIYVATGGSMDTVKNKFQTPIAYTYELRDRGQNGFILPASEIIPTSIETIDSLVSIFKSYRARHS
ncbi:zinc carboxypeptidase-like [Euwallacea fornicatus]|uniref:zinc carboxypeptidase-like n=1 Tax=Euwallacea fornicatus TaxID=995702 RepID=UPI00338EAF1E